MDIYVYDKLNVHRNPTRTVKLHSVQLPSGRTCRYCIEDVTPIYIHDVGGMITQSGRVAPIQAHLLDSSVVFKGDEKDGTAMDNELYSRNITPFLTPLSILSDSVQGIVVIYVSIVYPSACYVQIRTLFIRQLHSFRTVSAYLMDISIGCVIYPVTHHEYVAGKVIIDSYRIRSICSYLENSPPVGTRGIGSKVDPVLQYINVIRIRY